MAETGRRERKNEQTRTAIARAACELVLERGFERTTMGEIAERADVARRTVHGWFRSKDDIILAPLDEPIDRLEHELRSGEGNVVDRLERYMRNESRRMHAEDELRPLRLAAITSDPHLRALERQRFHRVEVAITDAVAAALGRDSVAPHAFAAATVSILLELRTRYVHNKPASAEIVAESFAFLRAALAALQRP